jgi:Tfp pilus assembly protein PilF
MLPPPPVKVNRSHGYARRVRATLGLRGSWLLIVAGLLLSSCGGSAKSSSTNSSHAPFRVLIGAGMDLLRQGNSSAAQQLFEQAIAREPNNPVGHYDLGVVLQRVGDSRDALHQYRLALASDPQYTPALFNEAVVLAPRDPTLAIFDYHRIIAIKPNSPTALLNLGLLEAAVGYPHRVVLSNLRRAVALDPSLRQSVPPGLRRDI